MKKTPLGNQDCKGCPGLCCNGLEDSIIRPTTTQDVENLKWELHFVNTKIFIRNKRWYKMSTGQCRYLGQDYRCTIYDRRPQICRDHNPPACEFHGAIADVMFHDPDQLQAYIDSEKEGRRAARSKAKTRKKPRRK